MRPRSLSRLLCFTGSCTCACLLLCSSAALASDPAHLSQDLAAQVSVMEVIVHGSVDEVRAIAARHGVRIKQLLHSGAVLEADAAEVESLRHDALVDHLSGNAVITLTSDRAFLNARGAPPPLAAAPRLRSSQQPQALQSLNLLDDVIQTIGADELWHGVDGKPGATGKGIGIAVIDSGIWARHPALQGHVVAAVDFTGEVGQPGADLYGHGTHVAGIIAGSADGFTGVAPGAHLVSLKVIAANGTGRTSAAIEAIDWAIAMGQDRIAPPTIAAQPARWSSLDQQPAGHRRHPLGAEDRRAVVRPARGISEAVHMLASVETLGRGWDVAPSLAHVHRRTGRARAVAVGDRVHRWHLRLGETMGPDIGPTKRRKGSKCMVFVERQGLPLGITIAAASPAEVTLVDATLATRVTPHRWNPKHLLGDRAHDSDPVREQLADRGIVLTSPYRDNNLHRRYEDARRLRTYRHRWIIQRTIAWFGAFRRLLVRHERSTKIFLAFSQLAPALIALRTL